MKKTAVELLSTIVKHSAELWLLPVYRIWRSDNGMVSTGYSKENSAQQWSPWLCLLIVLLGFVLSLIIAVLDSPENRFLSFSSGYWLPMILQTTIGCFTVVTFYTFWWEVQALLYGAGIPGDIIRIFCGSEEHTSTTL